MCTRFPLMMKMIPARNAAIPMTTQLRLWKQRFTFIKEQLVTNLKRKSQAREFEYILSNYTLLRNCSNAITEVKTFEDVIRF